MFVTPRFSLWTQITDSFLLKFCWTALFCILWHNCFFSVMSHRVYVFNVVCNRCFCELTCRFGDELNQFIIKKIKKIKIFKYLPFASTLDSILNTSNKWSQCSARTSVYSVSDSVVYAKGERRSARSRQGELQTDSVSTKDTKTASFITWIKCFSFNLLYYLKSFDVSD